MATGPISIELDQKSQELIRHATTAYGRDRFYAAVVQFFARKGQVIAGQANRELRNRLRRRTGSLGRAIVGGSELYKGLPAVRVGVLEGPASPYAAVHEFGTKGKEPTSPIDTIRPKRARALAAPMGPALTPSGVARFASPRDYPEELKFIPFGRQGSNVVGGLFEKEEVDEERRNAAEAGDTPTIRNLTLVYLLLRQVDFEPRRYIRDPFTKALPKLAADLVDFATRYLAGGTSGPLGRAT